MTKRKVKDDAAAAPQAAARVAKPKTRTNDPDRTKANIIEITTP
ncbi:hypothetical protein [Phenylobacterium sp.]|nr:hypothetical protein [Phenylobacterium sp.]